MLVPRIMILVNRGMSRKVGRRVVVVGSRVVLGVRRRRVGVDGTLERG
jgi:hypothetical protein